MNVVNIIILVCILDLILLSLFFIKLFKIKKSNRKLEDTWVEELKNDPNITEDYINGFIDGLKQVDRLYD